MSSWDRTFFEVCSAVAGRSKDASTKVGACVVDAKNALVSAGYNGFARGARDDELPAARPEKYAWTVHAETNAVLFAVAALGRYMLDGCTLYSTHAVCSGCLLLAAHVGVRRVVQSAAVPAVCAADRDLCLRIASHFGMEVLTWDRSTEKRAPRPRRPRRGKS